MFQNKFRINDFKDYEELHNFLIEENITHIFIDLIDQTNPILQGLLIDKSKTNLVHQENEQLFISHIQRLKRPETKVSIYEIQPLSSI